MVGGIRGTSIIAVPPSWHTEACEGRKGGEEPLQPGSHQKYRQQLHQIEWERSSFPHLPAEDEGIRIQESCLLGSIARLLLSDCMQFRHTHRQIVIAGGREEGRQRQTESQREVGAG